MIDTVQAILLFVIVLLTIVLIVLGIQIFFILRDFRKTLEKANKVLDNANLISGSIVEPVSMVSALLSNTSSLATILKIVLGSKRRIDRRDL